MWQTVTLCVLAGVISTVLTFEVGVKSTKCNLDPSKGELNDPCMSLYDGVCGGKYCTCPAGTHEDKGLRRCVPGEAPKTKTGGTQAGGGGSDLFDLPFDYEPNKPAPAPGPVPAPAPAPQPRPPSQPRPPLQPEQPQPGQPQPGQPQPGGNDIGEKAGGGVGGVLGLLLIGGLLYFCCCRGGKHKEMMNRFQGLPFMRGGGAQAPGGAVQMQQSAYVQQDPNFGAQHTYIPPGTEVQPGQYPPQQPYPAGGIYPATPYAPQPGYAPYPPADGGPPMQPYPPQPNPPYPPQAAPYVATAPPGYTADGQQPPPYTQQYQPNVQPPQ